MQHQPPRVFTRRTEEHAHELGSHSLPYADRHVRIDFDAGTAPRLLITTTGADDQLSLDSSDDALLLTLNRLQYRIQPIIQPLTLVIDTDAGDDVVRAQRLHGKTELRTGAGDDLVKVGAGNFYIDAGAGDDTVLTRGNGMHTIYAGDGDDTCFGGEQLTFMAGGAGDDRLVAGAGLSVISPGPGGDSIFPGSGSNVVYSSDEDDSILREEGTLRLHRGSDHRAGNQALRIEGSDGFVKRVEADLDLLRTSPTARLLLAALDEAANVHGTLVTVRFTHEPNGYFGHPHLPMIDGQRAPAGQSGELVYNPAWQPPGSFPVVVLYHELCHAYNFATGSMFGFDHERQVVGLPTEHPPFDFDDDPQTPPLNTNPDPFNENSLRRELGLPPRLNYP
ncbi:M91 family zinc metallopeptidase [Pseudomonas sp. CFBP 13719]|uniref:M91 family zinc metallopeptidase n=1 Tax=Pseudomonas sp. CFBP 13719 TaxID=2775303 RepID=UPI001782794D|nr:M91 family zinc metallopeptidase [Pseudomonas sp. CFBP 13719]MBD8684343.1 hypothetical protein [Pseudomonas sp. CFBP 13719]